MSVKKNFLRLAGLVGLCALPALSSDHFFVNQPNFIYTTLDFGAQVAGHLQWSTWTTPSGSAGTKFVQVQLGPKSGGAGQCYSIHVEAPGGTANPDLQFWTPDSRSIDDDGPAGDRRPNARLWITSSFNLKVSAFNNASNSVDFAIYNFLESATSAAACDDGVSPFYNQATNVITRANSLVN